LRVANVQEFLIQPPYERAAADEGSAEAYSFLFRKANYLDTERKSPSLQLFEQGDGEHNSEDAIVSTGVRDCIEVGTYQEARRVRQSGRIKSVEISGGIDSRLGAQRFHPAGDFLMAITHGRRQERPSRAGRVFCKRR
jgi:hypothetical protein